MQDRDSIASLFPAELVHRLSSSLDPHARDESAIPSYTHWNPAIRWLMFRRLELTRRMALGALAREPGGAGAAVLDYGCGVGMLIPALDPRFTETPCSPQPRMVLGPWPSGRSV